MLHFFPRYANDVSNDSFAIALRDLQVPHRFFAAKVNLRYRTKLGLVARVYPRLAWFSARSAVRSMLLSHPRPTAAIVGSDVEALIFGLMKRIFWRKTLIVYQTAIMSPRRGRLFNAICALYYRLVFSVTDIAICHSSIEVTRFRAAFQSVQCRFVFVPFGTTVAGREKLMAACSFNNQDRWIVAAGRSGRDYATVVKALENLPCRLLIICDTAAPVAGIKQSDRIKIVGDCFGDSYFECLANALFVLVPLSVEDVSAGQMVLLQAQALGKAIIATRTTIAEYAADEQDALLVGMGDVEQMRSAIIRLLNDAALRAKLGANAAARFERDHTTEVYVRRLVDVVWPVRPVPDTPGMES
jgi:glycosyltransferase involved in cell wall biosynthesis